MGSGYKAFTAGEVLTASDVNNYLMEQSVMVFADSTARASTIGTANFEEGMVSYLEDSDTVEVYDGSAWGGIAPVSNQGLTLLNTTSFSGVASQSFNDVFSTTYNSYMLVFSNLTCVTGTTNNLMMRLRVSGTDNSSNNYENGRYFVGAFQATAAASTDSELESRFLLGQMTNLIQQGGIVYVHNPFLTANTAQNSLWASSLLDINAGVTTVTTSYTGFTVFPAAGGNFSGTVSIYGFAK